MGLIFADGKEFISGEKRRTKHKVEYLAGDVPAFRLMYDITDNGLAGGFVSLFASVDWYSCIFWNAKRAIL